MVVAANTYGSATSGVATLSVTADTAAPYVSSVLQYLVGGNGHRVQVVFSEPVLPGTATNLSNYAMNGGLVVTNITLLDDLTHRHSPLQQHHCTWWQLFSRSQRRPGYGASTQHGVGRNYPALSLDIDNSTTERTPAGIHQPKRKHGHHQSAH